METETRELSSVSRGKIRPSETGEGHKFPNYISNKLNFIFILKDDWKNEKLFVPPLPPTNLRGCHIIRIQYDVFVSGKNSFSQKILWKMI